MFHKVDGLAGISELDGKEKAHGQLTSSGSTFKPNDGKLVINDEKYVINSRYRIGMTRKSS